MDSQANHVTGRRRLGAANRISRHPIRSMILVAIASALATIALVLASSSNLAVAASSLVNGNFETGDLTGWSVDTTASGGGANVVASYDNCLATREFDPTCSWSWPISMSPQEGSYFALLTLEIEAEHKPHRCVTTPIYADSQGR